MIYSWSKVSEMNVSKLIRANRRIYRLEKRICRTANRSRICTKISTNIIPILTYKNREVQVHIIKWCHHLHWWILIMKHLTTGSQIILSLMAYLKVIHTSIFQPKLVEVCTDADWPVFLGRAVEAVVLKIEEWLPPLGQMMAIIFHSILLKILHSSLI